MQRWNNITKCADGVCPYGQKNCCYECDHRIRDGCRVRCSNKVCRREHLIERIWGKEKK